MDFRIGSVSSIGGLIAATLFAATVSDSQTTVAERVFEAPALTGYAAA